MLGTLTTGCVAVKFEWDEERELCEHSSYEMIRNGVTFVEFNCFLLIVLVDNNAFCPILQNGELTTLVVGISWTIEMW